jgi:hypothetical protein
MHFLPGYHPKTQLEERQHMNSSEKEQQTQFASEALIFWVMTIRD